MTESFTNDLIFNVLDIIRGTTVDGPGLRTSIYLSGCHHHCRGCHNPQSWDPDSGVKMSMSHILEIVDEEDFDVTLTGGDPLFNPSAISRLIDSLKKKNRNIWVYTGFTWNEILMNENLLKAVQKVDVVVDGPFIENLKDPDLPFKGSSNQNIIDVKKSLQYGKIILFK